MIRKATPLALFVFFTVLLGLESAFDAYLNLKYPVTAASELNPLARWILECNGDGDQGRAVMLSLKFAGTILTTVFLWTFFHFSRTRSWAWIIVLSLTTFQTSVLLYMTDGFRFI